MIASVGKVLHFPVFCHVHSINLILLLSRVQTFGDGTAGEAMPLSKPPPVQS